MSDDHHAMLVRRTLGGDERAFEELLRGCEPELRHLLDRCLAGRPDASVDEALQDLRIYLFRRLDRYDPRYPFRVFARGLARSIAKRHLYRRSDLAPAPLDDEEERCCREELSPLELESLPRNLRAVLGEGRFAPPGGNPPPSRTFLELLTLFFRHGGYPHQQVSFGYSILLWGRCGVSPGEASGEPHRRKVPVTGDPDRVVREIGPAPLAGSSGAMIRDLQEEGSLPAPFVDRAAAPLRQRLDLIGAQLFAGDGTSLRLFAHLEARRVGTTLLREYFGRDERKSVADWSHLVKERMRRALADSVPGERAPAPRPP